MRGSPVSFVWGSIFSPCATASSSAPRMRGCSTSKAAHSSVSDRRWFSLITSSKRRRVRSAKSGAWPTLQARRRLNLRTPRATYGRPQTRYDDRRRDGGLSPDVKPAPGIPAPPYALERGTRLPATVRRCVCKWSRADLRLSQTAQSGDACETRHRYGVKRAHEYSFHQLPKGDRCWRG